jgi:hypothetical protein
MRAVSRTLGAAKLLVPLAGIEPALLAELDFESSASTSSATGALETPWPVKGWGSRSRRNIAGGGFGSTGAAETILNVPRSAFGQNTAL